MPTPRAVAPPRTTIVPPYAGRVSFLAHFVRAGHLRHWDPGLRDLAAAMRADVLGLEVSDELTTGRFRVTSKAVSNASLAAGDPSDTQVRRATAMLELNGEKLPLAPPGETMPVVVGAFSVEGLNEALLAMRPGERRRLRKFLERLGQADYGYGWRSYDYAGHRIVGHRGGVSGYRSLILFDPERKGGVVAMWNSNTNQPGGLEFEVMDMLYRLPFRDAWTIVRTCS